MNNRLTWLFIISSLFLSWGTLAQEKEEVKTKKEIKYKRARNEDGHFIADDPETLDINEAWVKV